MPGTSSYDSSSLVRNEKFFEVLPLQMWKTMKPARATMFGSALAIISFGVVFVQCAFSAHSEVPRLLAQSDEKDMMSIAEAKQYMIALINRDRKSQGLKEVTADGTADRAGEMHSDEMARLGFLSHWDLMGRKPDQRYCSVGGTAYVMENGHIEFSGFPGDDAGGTAEYKLDPDAKLSKKDIEDIETGFFNEQPPNDGHRRNILDPDHNKVGIGLSVARKGDSHRLTCAQEFLHSYGKVEAVPGSVKVGESFVVKGSIDPGLSLQSVDLFWEELPKPMTLKELNETYSYGPPQMRINTYFPGAPAARDNLAITDNAGRQEFACRFDTDKALWKPGLYYVYVWVKTPDPTRKKNLVIASKVVEVR